MDRFPELLTGAALTIRLSALAMVFGLLIGTACSVAKVYGSRPLRWMVGAYVEFIRNTPFLVQLYFVFFALPKLGLRMDSNTAALVAMVVNLGAYSTEI